MERRGTSTAYGFEARKLTEAATGKRIAVFGLHRHLSLHGPAAGLLGNERGCGAFERSGEKALIDEGSSDARRMRRIFLAARRALW